MATIDALRLDTQTEVQRYPITKGGLLAELSQNGTDEEILSLIEDLPPKLYRSHREVVREIRNVETMYQLGVWRADVSDAEVRQERLDMPRRERATMPLYQEVVVYKEREPELLYRVVG